MAIQKVVRIVRTVARIHARKFAWIIARMGIIMVPPGVRNVVITVRVVATIVALKVVPGIVKRTVQTVVMILVLQNVAVVVPEDVKIAVLSHVPVAVSMSVPTIVLGLVEMHVKWLVEIIVREGAN